MHSGQELGNILYEYNGTIIYITVMALDSVQTMQTMIFVWSPRLYY